MHREDGQLQILLEGLQRFRVRRWVTEKPPLSAAAQYFPERMQPDDGDAQKAYARITSYNVCYTKLLRMPNSRHVCRTFR